MFDVTFIALMPIYGFTFGFGFSLAVALVKKILRW
jgi:hypothetical protein